MQKVGSIENTNDDTKPVYGYCLSGFICHSWMVRDNFTCVKVWKVCDEAVNEGEQYFHKVSFVCLLPFEMSFWCTLTDPTITVYVCI